MNFPEYGVLIHGQIDDTVGNDHIHAIVRQRDFLDVAFKKLDIGDAQFGFIGVGGSQHFIGHV